MRAHLALGEQAEALRVYRRCRDLLASVLGTTPNAATQALYAQAQQAGPGAAPEVPAAGAPTTPVGPLRAAT